MTTKLIEKLTPAQEARFAEFVARWKEIGLSTAPADRPRAEAGIAKAYAAAGLKPPRVVWCSSPLSMGLTRAVVLNFAKEVKTVASVRASVWASVGASVWASVGASVRDSVRDSVWDSVGASVGDSVYGQHDASWLGFYEFFREALGLKSQTEPLAGMTEIAQAAGWFLPHAEICWVAERHNTLRLDTRGWLHADDGPAFGYPDGWGEYYWHGTRVSPEIVLRPETITASAIAAEGNAELRRIMVERYEGLRYRGAYMVDAGATVVHQDEWGTLYRQERPGDTPLVMVKVRNSTTEPDGTMREFFLRVDPDLRPMKRLPDGAMEFGRAQSMTARNAVASTFGRRGDEYAPVIES